MRSLRTLIPILVLLCLSGSIIPVGGAADLFKKRSPIERRAKRYGLVPVQDAAPGVFVDLRYKFTSAAGKPLYLKDMPCLVHAAAGKKLKAAQIEVAKQGYALKIWDAWRPPEAHKALWDAVKDPKYVVPPEKGLSWHCYGISIDLTLVRKDGAAVKMPTKFDAFTPLASSTYKGSDAEVKQNLQILQTAMLNAGFRKINDEWWHFDDAKSAKSIRNVSAKDLGIAMPSQ